MKLPPGHFVWPTTSPQEGVGAYIWIKRDSSGSKEGPGNNVFCSDNVAINSQGELVIKVEKHPAGNGMSSRQQALGYPCSSAIGTDSRDVMWTCGEVFLDRSLGFGQYEFTVATDPSDIHPNLVASPFLYACQDNEFDIEYARWGEARIANVQYVLQPHTAPGALKRFDVTGGNLTHVITWLGGDSPADVHFKTLGPDGRLLHSWRGTGGNNFQPGAERVHINHWVSAGQAAALAGDSSALPACSAFVLSNFKFTPLTELLRKPARKSYLPFGCCCCLTSKGCYEPNRRSNQQ